MAEPLLRELRALTSLRFVAAIWVVGFHYLEYLPSGHWLTRSFFREGVVAVDFFFVLSGFILMHTYAAQVETRRFRYADFLVRRLARIYPAHLFMLAVFIAFALLSAHLGVELENPDRYRPSAILPNLLLIHSWGGSPAFSFNYPSWSISAEWMAYILFPVVAFAALRLMRAFEGSGRSRVWTAGVALAALLLVWGGVWLAMGRSVSDLTTQHVALRILPEFFLGACLYLVARSGGRCRPRAIAILAAGIVALAQAQAPHVALVAGSAALILAAALANRGDAGLLDSPAFVYLGRISYGLYMIHIFLAALLFKAAALSPISLDPLVVFLSGMVVTTALAALFHHLIEAPGQKLVLQIWSGFASSRRPPSIIDARP